MMEPEASTTPLGPRRRIAAKSVAPQAAQTPLASEAFERQEFTSRLNTVERPVSAASSAFDPWNWSVALFLFPTLAIVAFRCGRSFVVASALFGIVMYLFDLSDNRALVVATATLMVAALSVLCAVTQGLREGPTFRLGLDIAAILLLLPWILLQYGWEEADQWPKERLRAVLLSCVGIVATGVVAPELLIGAEMSEGLLSYTVAVFLSLAHAAFALPLSKPQGQQGEKPEALPKDVRQRLFFFSCCAPTVVYLLMSTSSVLEGLWTLFSPRWVWGLDRIAEFGMAATLPLLLMWPQVKAGALSWLEGDPGRPNGHLTWEEAGRNVLRLLGYEDPVGGEMMSVLSLAGESLGTALYANVIGPTALVLFLFGVQQRIVQRVLAPILRLPIKYVTLSLSCTTLAVCIGLSTLPRLLTPPLHASAALPLPGALGKRWNKQRVGLIGSGYNQESSLGQFDALEGIGSWRKEAMTDLNLERMLLRTALALSSLSLGLIIGSGWQIVVGTLTFSLGLAQFLIDWSLLSALVSLLGLAFWMNSAIASSLGFLEFDFRPIVDAQAAKQLLPETFLASQGITTAFGEQIAVSMPTFLTLLVCLALVALAIPFLVWNRVRRPGLVTCVYIAMDVLLLTAELHLLGPAPEEFALSSANSAGWSDGACTTPAYPSFALALTSLATTAVAFHLSVEEAISPLGAWLSVVLAVPRVLSLHCPRSMSLGLVPSVVLPFALSAPYFLLDKQAGGTASKPELGPLEATLAQMRVVPPTHVAFGFFGGLFFLAISMSKATVQAQLPNLTDFDLMAGALWITLVYLSVLYRFYHPSSSVRVVLGLGLAAGVAIGMAKQFGLGFGFRFLFTLSGGLAVLVGSLSGMFSHSSLVFRCLPLAVASPLLAGSAADVLYESIWNRHEQLGRRWLRSARRSRWLFQVVAMASGISFGILLSLILFVPMVSGLQRSMGGGGTSGPQRLAYGVGIAMVMIIVLGTGAIVFGGMPKGVHPTENERHVELVLNNVALYSGFALFVLGAAAKSGIATSGDLPIYRHVSWVSAALGFCAAAQAVSLTAGSSSLAEELTICILPALFLLLDPRAASQSPGGPPGTKASFSSTVQMFALPGITAGMLSFTRGILVAFVAQDSFRVGGINSEGAWKTQNTVQALQGLHSKLADRIRNLLASEAVPRLSVYQEDGAGAAMLLTGIMVAIFGMQFWAYMQLSASNVPDRGATVRELVLAPLPLVLAVIGNRRQQYCLAILASAMMVLVVLMRQQRTTGRSLSSRSML